MLLNTFQHLKGIAKKTERALWNRGVLSWDDYARMKNHQLVLFDDLAMDAVQRSFDAYQKGDMGFFARYLPKSEYYRVALTYPNETLFLDIETTGLSLHYDQITVVGWSIGRKYGLFVRDEDPHGMLDVLKSAKAIVTFNGTIFDIKFLEKAFPGLHIPPIHIDLRFLAKRVGLSGGQKSIETQLGFRRPNTVREMQGESAPILWYRYRRGDLKAFKRLVTYNHADIEGMKYILDYSIQRVFQENGIPKQVQSRANFSKLRSKPEWTTTRDNNNPYLLHLVEYKGNPKPLIRYDDLNRIIPLSQTVVVGIDLVSSEQKESGYCILIGNRAETFRVKSDQEMIRMAIDAKATLISIDSPLSIPKGRTSFFDDDPQRHQFGIMRECERILKKRGINVYPCLIPSMQKLTRRGIELASKFRKLGIPVIESYPGAAQDILGIPRKRAGLKYLADALLEFGIFDNFSEREISHDELDAITSAIVGIFFWTGKFEAIGNEDEEYLIIPDTKSDPGRWLDRKIIGLSGPIAAGKTTSARFLEKRGFHYGRFSSVLEGILRERGMQPSRQEMQKLGNEINVNDRQRWLCKKLIEQLQARGNLVIDGLRHPEDHSFLTEVFGPAFLHIHVITPETVRLQRYVTEGKTRDDFLEAISHPVEQNVPAMESLAHITLPNEKSIRSLRAGLVKSANLN
jgi:uncharacterized protein YprB with RNaseH-like and TPR domain/predicted nuclease with RNAse H fold/dephospho-CoA kinase